MGQKLVMANDLVISQFPLSDFLARRVKLTGISPYMNQQGELGICEQRISHLFSRY
jgi:hypothetical protein